MVHRHRRAPASGRTVGWWAFYLKAQATGGGVPVDETETQRGRARRLHSPPNKDRAEETVVNDKTDGLVRSIRVNNRYKLSRRKHKKKRTHAYESDASR